MLIRFEILHPHKEAVRKMITFMAKPEHAELGSRWSTRRLTGFGELLVTALLIFNFYTKRAILGVVYGATMLAFLDDDTPDMQKTRAFLDRRLQDVAKIPKVTKPLRAAANMVGTVASRIFTAGTNKTSS